MATFHRLTTPSYFGGLPAGYDLINSGSAAADIAKVGGPNAGTYWHAFGEDATSSNFNRPAKAFSENCDYLDDLFHRDVVVMHKTADVLAGGAVASIVLPAGTYLGGSGYTNNAVSRARLFSVRDNSDRPIIDTAIAEVVVTSVTLSGGDAIGGGFSANSVTLNLSPSIPGGTTYRVYYGVRENLSVLDTDTIPSGRDFALIYGHTTMPVGAHQAQAIWYAGGAAWPDTTTNPATTVELQLDKILADLGDQGGAGGGAYKVGFNTGEGAWFETITFATTTVGDFLHQVDQAFLGLTAVSAFHVTGGLTVDGILTVGNVIAVNRVVEWLVRSTPISGFLSDVLSWRVEWDIDSGAAMVQADVTGGGLQSMIIPIDVPAGSVIGSITAFVQGASGHVSLPTGSERMEVLVYKQRLTTGVLTLIGNAVDASASVGAYEAGHTIAFGFDFETVDYANYTYFIQITGERGANAVAGTRYFGSQINTTISQL